MKEFKYLGFGGLGDLYAYGAGEPIFVAHAMSLPRTPTALIEALRAIGLSDGNWHIPCISLSVAERLFR